MKSKSFKRRVRALFLPKRKPRMGNGWWKLAKAEKPIKPSASVLPLVLLSLLALQSSAAEFVVTAYCPCARCCGRWAGGPTASGRMPEAGVTIAAPRRIPFGKWVKIEGLGVRRVDDRLARRFDARIDVFFPTHAEALRFGKRTLKATVL